MICLHALELRAEGKGSPFDLSAYFDPTRTYPAGDISPELSGKIHGRKNSYQVPEEGVDPKSLWGFSELDPKGEKLEALLAGHFAVVIFNKSANRLYLARYNGEKIELLKSYHALYGKLPGDKHIEGDLRTPEGVYYFNSFAKYPQISKKLGEMAIGLNYPNPIDKLDGKTGYDILLHATFEDGRLQRNFDSEGCVVTQNKNVEEISHFVQLGVTPMLIYGALKPEHLEPQKFEGLPSFFNKWVAAWNDKNLESYMESYSQNRFVAPDGKKWSDWKTYKGFLNRRYKWINVKARDVRYFIHPKYTMVLFKQDYRSDKYHSVGTKFLYVENKNGKYQIVSEDFSRVVDSPVLVKQAISENVKRKPSEESRL